MERACGDTGILGGGVGGTGELFGAALIADNVDSLGMLRAGYRFLGVEFMELRVTGDVILVGRVLGMDMQSSLISVSSSVASYRSSKPAIWCCHSVSEQDELEPPDSGETRRSSLTEGAGRPVVFSLSCGVTGAAGEEPELRSALSPHCDSRVSSSIIVLSTVPRACRRGGHVAVGSRRGSAISPGPQILLLLYQMGATSRVSSDLTPVNGESELVNSARTTEARKERPLPEPGRNKLMVKATGEESRMGRAGLINSDGVGG